MDAPPAVEYFQYDALSAAFHEIGHGVIQAVTDLGPDRLVIREEAGGWFGHAKLSKTAETASVQLLDLMSLAGPVAQLIFAEESLGRYADMLRESILDRSSDLLGSEPLGRIIMELHWAGDLQNNSQLLVRARQAAGGGVMHPFAYLSAEEKALRAFFKVPEVEALVRDHATQLATVHEVDAGTFIQDAKKRVPGTALRLLLGPLENNSWLRA